MSPTDAIEEVADSLGELPGEDGKGGSADPGEDSGNEDEIDEGVEGHASTVAGWGKVSTEPIQVTIPPSAFPFRPSR